MPNPNSRRQVSTAYLFKSPQRLTRAKADLLGYLLRNGAPKPDWNYVASRLHDRVGHDSPLVTALDAWEMPLHGSVKLQDAIAYLRQSIYQSELHFGTPDRFETQVAALLNTGSREEAAPVALPPAPVAPVVKVMQRRRSTVSSVIRGIFSTMFCGVVLVVIAWFALTGYLVGQAERDARQALGAALSSYQAALSDVAVSLPLYYAQCRESNRGFACAGGARAERDLLSALDATALSLSALAASQPADAAAPALTAMVPDSCGTINKTLTNTQITRAELCQVRLRLTDHLLCVTRPDGIALDHCSDLSRLGVLNTRFEQRDAARPANVFTQSLELPDELRQFAAIADAPWLRRLQHEKIAQGFADSAIWHATHVLDWVEGTIETLR